MRFKSSVAITSRISKIVLNAFTNMKCSTNTLIPGEYENKGSNDDPIWVLSVFSACIDEYKVCTVYVFHNSRVGILQVFIAYRYSHEHIKIEEELQKEEQFMDTVRATYKYCLRYDEAKWQEYWNELNQDYEIEYALDDQFAVKLIDIKDTNVMGDVKLEEVVNCKKLANMVCSVMRDMGGSLRNSNEIK